MIIFIFKSKLFRKQSFNINWTFFRNGYWETIFSRKLTFFDTKYFFHEKMLAKKSINGKDRLFKMNYFLSMYKMALFELSNSSFVMVKKIEIVIFFNCQLRKNSAGNECFSYFNIDYLHTKIFCLIKKIS